MSTPELATATPERKLRRRSSRVLAPARWVMDRLTYPRKFALVSVLFVLPLAAVLYFLLAEINSRIQFASSELDGTRYLREVRGLQHQVGQAQHLAALFGLGKTALRPELIRRQGDIDEALAKLDAVDKVLGLSLNTASKQAVLRENRRFLREALFGQQGLNTVDLHKQLLGDIARLNAHVGDSSNLILDPDLDTFYLMDTVLLKLPSTADLLVELRLLLTGAGARSMLRAEESADIVRLAALLGAEAGRTRDALKVIYANTAAPQLASRLSMSAGNYDQSMLRLVTSLRRDVSTGADIPALVARLDVLIGEATQANLAFGDVAFNELDALLKARIAGVERQRLLVLAFSGVSLLLVVYLLMAFYASVMGIVQRLRAASERMRSGDFVDTLTLETRDELGQVATAFNTVALSLRDEKAQAEAESTRAKAAEAEVRAREADLVHAREEALGAVRAKAAFLATMSHEIRTPLNGVVGMASLLAETSLDPEQLDYLQTIRLSSDQLLAVINDILDFSKIESGKLDIEAEPLSLRAAVEEACDIAAPRAREKGIELIIDIAEQRPGQKHAPGGVPPAILGDITRLRQVLINLINNAVKFTEKGEVAIHVRRLEPVVGDLSKYLADDGAALPGPNHVLLEFRVTDSGIGIPPERVNALFQAFTQVDTSTTRKYGGTGLGLAICKRLVELMGGRIGVESTLGQGSSFWFTVAASLAQLPPTQAPAEVDLLNGKRALVVDDHATNVRILTRQLQLWGIQVASAMDAAGALQWMEKAMRDHPETWRPDVIITDMHMPEMDGLTLAGIIKARPEWHSIPLVLLSSGFMPGGDRQTNLFAARLLKPTRQAQLLDTVARCVSPNASQRQAPAVAVQLKKHITILVADDNEVNLKVASAILGKLGYDSVVVPDGAEAAQAVAESLAKGQPFGAVLMDLNMPGMDGLEATRLIQATHGSSAPPIIAVTAAASPEDRARCEAAGMQDYLTKPLHVAGLIQALDKWIVFTDKNTAVVEVISAPNAPENEAQKPVLGAEPEDGPEDGPEAAPPAAALIDWSRLQELREMDDAQLSMVRDLLAVFTQQVPQIMQTLQHAIAAKDASALAQAAHKLRGAASNVGANALCRVCEQLETDALLGGVPHDAAARAQQLEAAWPPTREQLLAWLEQPSADNLALHLG